MLSQYTENSRGYLSPGVSYSEREVLPLIHGPEDLTTGIIGTAPKGPKGNVSIYNHRQLYQTFGTPTKDDLGLIAASYMLNYSNHVIFNRVTSKSAKEGTVSDPSDYFKFFTKTEDGTLNGCKLRIEYLEDHDILGYTILSTKGSVLEQDYGFTLTEGQTDSFISLFNKRSEYLKVEKGPKYKDLLESYDQAKNPVEGVEDPPGFTFETLELEISGGDSGLDVTPEDICGTSTESGIKAFMSPDSVDVSTLITPGYSHEPEVLTQLEELTKYRGDVMVIIDPPEDLTPAEVINWTNGKHSLDIHKVDNEWFSVYYPYVVIPFGGEYLTVPPSTVVASQWSYSDQSSHCWFAPAGYGNDPQGRGRGYLQGVVDVAYETSKEDRDNLYGYGNIINPIAKFVGRGIVLFGNKTSLRTPFGQSESYMTAISVRRLCNYIRKIVVSVSYTELFNPNDEFTWNSWRLKIEPKLKVIQTGRGLEAYKVVMDKSTVTNVDIRYGRMPGIIYVKPTRAVEYIPITFVVTDNDIHFEEGSPLQVGPDYQMISRGSWDAPPRNPVL